MNNGVNQPLVMIYTPFKELREGRADGKTVKVLVLRKWREMQQSTGKVFSLDLQMMDQHGTQMQARVCGSDMALFNGIFLEGRVYTITGFYMAELKTGWKVVAFRFTLLLNRFSAVHQLQDDPSIFPPEAFALLELERLVDRLHDKTSCTAVIGKLKSMSNTFAKPVIDCMNTRNVTIPVREVEIENERGVAVKIVVWGDLVQAIEEDVLNVDGKVPIVMIVTGTRIKGHQGSVVLWTSPASRLLVNPAVQQAYDFKGRLHPIAAAEVIKIGFELGENQNINKVSVLALTELLQDKKKQGTIRYCEAVVAGLALNRPWYYMACKTERCHKKVTSDQGSCNRCGCRCSGENRNIRYLLHLRVSDGTQDAIFTVVGQTAERMLGCTAEEHYQIKDQNESMMVFDRIVGEAFVFKVLIEKCRIQSGNFKVLEVLQSAPGDA